MLDDKNKLYVIDFPQMVSTNHLNCHHYFDRDIQCIRTLFKRKFHYVDLDEKEIDLDDIECIKKLDEDIQASGYMTKDQKKEMKDFEVLEQVLQDNKELDSEDEDDDDEDGDD